MLREEAQPAGFLAVSKALPTGQKILKESTPELQAAVLEVACEEILAATQGRFEDGRHYLARDMIQNLVKRRLAAPPDRVAAMLETCSAAGSAYRHWMPALSLLRLVSKPPTSAKSRRSRTLKFTMAESTSSGPRKIVERIDEILEGDERALKPGGAWSARVLADVAGLEPALRDAWCELMIHLLATGDPEPSKKWEVQLQVQLHAVGRPLFVERALEWLALGPMPGCPATPQVPERDADYLKGFVWALSAFDKPPVARALADLAEQCLKKVPNHGPSRHAVGNACIRVLARLGGTEPVAQLGRLRTRVKYAVGVQLIEKALTEAATRAGLTPEELEEIAVPRFNLDDAGTIATERRWLRCRSPNHGHR